MTARPAPTRTELVAHLVAVGLAGQVATPRSNSLRHFRLLADGDPYLAAGAAGAAGAGEPGPVSWRQALDRADPTR
jgi:hypothetical protein